MMKIRFTLFAVLMIHQTALTLTNDERIVKAKQLLYEGSTQENMNIVIEGYELLKNAYKEKPTRELLYFTAQAEYELVRLGVTDKKNKLYERYIDLALEKTEELKELHPEWSEAHALSSALHGYRIAYNPLNAVSAGPKSYYAAEEAVKLDSTNPRAWMVRGIVRLHMPTMFGGSAKEAIISFKKAIALFEGEGAVNQFEPSWGYLDALVWLGWAYQQRDEDEKARASFKKALAYEPRAEWIKKYFLEPVEKNN